MPNVSISPVFNGFQFFDNNGEPLSGGKLFQYEGGSSSIQQTTYTDTTGNTPNPNPIVFDSSGRINTDVWLENGLAYNLVITEADGTTVIDQVDNVIGVQASTPGNTPGISVWNDVLDTPSFISGTQFSLPGNYAGEFTVGNRVKSELQTGIFVYGTVSAVTVVGGNTQVTLVNDSNPLTGLLSLVSWSSLTANNRTIDAAAVAYNVPAAYTNSNTAGYQIKTNSDNITALNNRYSASQQVWNTSGTNAYTVTVSPPITSYSADAHWVLRFTNASTSTPITVDINGVGAAQLLAYDTSGTGYFPQIVAGQIGVIAYNGAQWILTNALPIAAGAPATGFQAFTSNGTFTVPAGVYTIKVTVQAGGGGGAQWLDPMGNPSGIWSGNGGQGGCAQGYLSVTPGQLYAVVVGAGGAGGTDSGAFGVPFLPYPQPGGNGGNSSFGGSILVATGGVGGGSYSAQAAADGTASGTVPFVPANIPYYNYGTFGWAQNTYKPGLPNPNLAGQNTGYPGGPGIVVVEW